MFFFQVIHLQFALFKAHMCRIYNSFFAPPSDSTQKDTAKYAVRTKYKLGWMQDQLGSVAMAHSLDQAMTMSLSR